MATNSAVNIAAKIVALTVVIIVIVTLVIPTIEQVQADAAKVPVDNRIDWKEYGRYWDKNVVISMDSSDAATVEDMDIVIDGHTYVETVSSRHTIMYADTMVIEINSASSSGSPFYIWGIDSTDTYYSASFVRGDAMELSYNHSAGTVTITFPGSEKEDVSFNTTSFFSFCTTLDNPTYAYASTFGTSYVSSEIMENNTAAVAGPWNMNVTINDTSTRIFPIITKSGVSVIYDKDTYSDVDLTATIAWSDLTPVDGYSNIYIGPTLTFTVTDGEDLTQSAAAARSYIKLDMVGISTDVATNSLLSIIPILLIIVAVMMAVALMRGKS